METRELIVINELTKYLNQLIRDGLSTEDICDLILKHHLRNELKINGIVVTDEFIINYIEVVTSP